MFEIKESFSGFSVDDLAIAKKFYEETLGIKVGVQEGMGFQLHLPGERVVFIYPKENHQSATFTILNFVVEDIDAVVKELSARGVEFEVYKEGPPQDETGILRGRSVHMGPDIAWFKDPAGNILSVLQN